MEILVLQKIGLGDQNSRKNGLPGPDQSGQTGGVL